MISYLSIRVRLVIFGLALILGSCKKMIQVPDPRNSITTDKQFSSDALANSAVAGMYASLVDKTWAFGILSQYTGLSSDELVIFSGTSSNYLSPMNTNTLVSTTSSPGDVFDPVYANIYQANAIIEGLTASSGVSDSASKEYMGEAKFLRAFGYFYLTNLFGSVPMPLVTDWNKTSTLAGTSSADVYKQIVQDLLDAKGSLASSYIMGKGERIRATKWAACALLSRVYLYQGDWADAEAMADSIIANTTLFGLTTDLTKAFNSNSTEAIWQIQQNSSDYNTGFNNGTLDGKNYIPANTSTPMTYYLSAQQVAAFEPGDKRYAQWVSSFVYAGDGKTYYYPYKYTLGPSQTQYGSSTIPQYYMALRLAELYLIRAEARANNGNTAGAAADINTIRGRAGLPPTTASSASDLLTAVAHERQTELFTEWGHRWLDLKRTGQALNVLSVIPLHSAINKTQLLYPMPVTDLQADPNLAQTPGY